MSVYVYVRPSVRLCICLSQIVFLISVKFGVYIEVSEWCMTVCSMTQSKVNVMSPWKLEIWPFSKAISSAIYNRSWQLTTDSWTAAQYLNFVMPDFWYLSYFLCHVTFKLVETSVVKSRPSVQNGANCYCFQFVVCMSVYIHNTNKLLISLTMLCTVVYISALQVDCMLCTDACSLVVCGSANDLREMSSWDGKGPASRCKLTHQLQGMSFVVICFSHAHSATH